MDKDTSVIEYVKYTSETASEVEIPFIEFTVCPSYDSAYISDAFEYYGLDKVKYRDKGTFYPTKNGNNSDLRLLFGSVTYDVHEIIMKIKIKR